MRAVANVDADLLGFDRRFNHRAQRRQNAIEDSGKLIPSRRGHESHVAVCGSHSAGMRYQARLEL